MPVGLNLPATGLVDSDTAVASVILQRPVSQAHARGAMQCNEEQAVPARK